MKKLLLLLGVVLFLFSCNNDYYIDTGVAKGKLDINMYEYFKTNHYDWDSTRLIIDRAGLTDVFTGENPDYKQITFFGPTNHSIRQYMIKKGYKKVADIPVADCASMIRKYIIKGKMMKEDFAFEVKGTTDGGTIVTKDDGRDIRVFRRKSDYGNVVDAGPVSLYVQSYAISTTIMIASANIEPTNGVVHSLSYTHMFGDF